MKRLLIALAFLPLALCASSQTSDTLQPPDLPAPVVFYPDTAHVPLPDSLHAFVLAYLPERNRKDVGHYQGWCAANIETYKDSTGKAHLKNPGKMQTYAGPTSVILYAYDAIGQKSEGVVAKPNALVQQLLMGQMYPRRMDLILQFKTISERNEADLKKVIQEEGIERINYLQQQ